MSTASKIAILREDWPNLNTAQRKQAFLALKRPLAEELFLSISAEQQAELLHAMTLSEKRSWLRFLPPDDLVDLIQVFNPDEREQLLSLLDDAARRDVNALLAYAEDDAGGLMNPEYIRLRPNMTVDEAIRYIRSQAKTRVETIYYAYVINATNKLLGVVSFRRLLLASPEKLVSDIMTSPFFWVPEQMDKEDVALFFAKHGDLMAMPVLDSEGRMKGIVTHDDIAMVVREEATEDMQKIGGMEALDAPYFDVSFVSMIKKRAGWLTALFFGEMLTASAMGQFISELEHAIILALFIPLIISSGGNSGSQASTLIIRSLALREIRLRDWMHVFVRELCSGLALGGILGFIGLLRVIIWQQWNHAYGEYYLLVAVSVAISLVCVVLWGTLSGSMLPFLLRRMGFDPASASAPLVATMVDVTGLVIYFTVSSLVLKGTML